MEQVHPRERADHHVGDRGGVDLRERLEEGGLSIQPDEAADGREVAGG